MIKTLYYILFGIITAIGLYFVISSFFGRYILWNATQFEAKAVLVVATAVTVRILYWAYQLGDVQNRWWAGLGAVVLAMVSFQAITVLGAMLFGRK